MPVLTSSAPLRVLLVEDNPADAELVVAQLEQAGFDFTWQRVDTESAYCAALDPKLDVILADFNMPTFSAPLALDLLNRSGLDVPLIVVSGSIGEETAVHVLHAGAADYLLKDRLARLGQAVRRATDARRLRHEKQHTQQVLRATEERTRFALNAARVGVWEADLTKGLTSWSEMLEEIHGLAPGTFGGTFQAFLDCIHADDRDQVRASIMEASPKQTDSNLVYRTTWPDGSVHWISGTGRTFFDESGRPIRAAGTGTDVTEQRALEEQYRQSQKMDAIGQLAGGVAHDFNNLLTAVLGYCSLLSEALGPASPHLADLGEIRRAAESAASLTRQLLAFSRRQILEPQVLDIRDSLREVEPMLRRLIGEHIDLSVRTHRSAGRVRADAGQIEQVILNLALNARDSMPNGGSLLIELAEVELDESYAIRHADTKPGRYVMLAVSDTGTGMDAATRARIFEPFFTTKRTGKGTGLGLSTVYGIVKQSRGNIWVYSELGHGTTFKVYFPQVDDPIAQHAAPVPAGSLRGSETILVVEDELSVRELVRKILERQGYQVLVATTPGEALALAESRPTPIHLLISDVVLPQMNGRALADQFVAARPGTSVLFMSGYTDDAIVHGGILEEGTPFLQKPFTPDGVAKKVREVLGRKWRT